MSNIVDNNIVIQILKCESLILIFSKKMCSLKIVTV